MKVGYPLPEKSMYSTAKRKSQFKKMLFINSSCIYNGPIETTDVQGVWQAYQVGGGRGEHHLASESALHKIVMKKYESRN